MKIEEAILSSPADELVAGPRVEKRSLSILWSPGMALVGVLIAIGITLRLTYYLLNPALSSDEAALALNLVHRSYSGIFGQLDFKQAGPAGFLVLQKFAITAFGPSPYALRLLPFTAGIAALILFYPVAKRLTGERVAILALALFAISDPLMTYAATNKQYSLDVAATLALYVVALTLPDRIGVREALNLTVFGAVAVWLSHAATFVLAAIGILLLIEAAKARRQGEFARISAAVLVWLGSFAAAYSATDSSVAHLQRSLAGTQPTPLGGHGQPGEPGFLQAYGGIARFLFGIPTLGHGIRTAIALVAIVLSVIGLVALSRQRRPRGPVLLLIPGAIALVAAALDKYVLAPRTFLFMIPALIILAVQGIFSVAATNRKPAVALGSAAFLILLASGAYAVIDHLGSHRQTTLVRALRYLTQNARSGDYLYVHLNAQLDFRYYLECGCFGTQDAVRKARALWPVRAPMRDGTFMGSGSPRLVAGVSNATVPAEYRFDLAPLRGRARVWVFLMDPTSDSQQALTNFLRRHGRRKDVFPRLNPPPTVSVAAGVPTETASVALYDLRTVRKHP